MQEREHDQGPVDAHGQTPGGVRPAAYAQWDAAGVRKPWWRRSTAVVVAATVVVAAGLGIVSAVHGSGAGTAGFSAPPADGGRYASADAVLSKLAAAGIPCLAPSPIANATAPGATSMIDCDSGAGGSDTVVVVFDTQADAVGFAASLTSGSMADLSPDAVVVYGLNWAVNTVPGYAGPVRRALGGQIVAGPSAPAS